ncbi:hypothetical protein DFP72DRAFT_1060217 [Ephemerocybe angulata]|uniref:F-box domain-containing protein n=1 Tax=Ephemerocybe angulata TaxID=980116 RepID=A0A8H6MG17_9AGAR|nr:hypothetical protein DFP72DRAFT_1060217 [Tulosesus angulatus]
MNTRTLQDLPDDVLLSLLQVVCIEEWVSVALTCKRFARWLTERFFWLSALKSTQRFRPIACPFHHDLPKCPLSELREIGLRTLRLERNWSLDCPRPLAPLGSAVCRAVHLGGHLDIIFQIPGTRLYLMHSMDDGHVACWDMGLGQRVTEPAYVAPLVIDVSAGVDELGCYSMALLHQNMKDGLSYSGIAVATVSYGAPGEAVNLALTFNQKLKDNAEYWDVFMTKEVVGAMMHSDYLPGNQPGEFKEVPLCVVAFNRASQVRTIIESDLIWSELTGAYMGQTGSSICDGDLFLLVEDKEESNLFRFPSSLLPTDDKIDHPAWIKFKGVTTDAKNSEFCKTIRREVTSADRPNLSVQGESEGVFSTNPYYGIPIVSIRKEYYIRAAIGEVNEDEVPGETQGNMDGEGTNTHVDQAQLGALNPITPAGTMDWDTPRRAPTHENPTLEARFWTSVVQELDSEGAWELEPGTAGTRTLVVSASSPIPGTVYESSESAWRLILIPPSGKVLAAVLKVEEDAPPAVCLVRFNVEKRTSTVHMLELPEPVKLTRVVGFSVDDHCGVVSLIDSSGIMFLVSYA